MKERLTSRAPSDGVGWGSWATANPALAKVKTVARLSRKQPCALSLIRSKPGTSFPFKHKLAANHRYNGAGFDGCPLPNFHDVGGHRATKVEA